MLLLYVRDLVSETNQAQVLEFLALEIYFPRVFQVELEYQIQDT